MLAALKRCRNVAHHSDVEFQRSDSQPKAAIDVLAPLKQCKNVAPVQVQVQAQIKIIVMLIRG